MTMISTHVEQKAFVSIADATIARNLLLKGLDLELVSDSTGLNIDIVEKMTEARIPTDPRGAGKTRSPQDLQTR